MIDYINRPDITGSIKVTVQRKKKNGTTVETPQMESRRELK